MYYRKPHYYETFACTADRCPDTCCAGWQILIDEDSLNRYGNCKGDFGIRLLNSIDWREGAFEQYEGRCSFLNKNNLCDLYQELGKEALCDTCRNYPRHMEEYEGIREFSLSLSCPEAAKRILGSEEKLRILETEDEIEETEDFEDFDFLLFDRLEEVRTLLFQTVQDRKLPIESRMCFVLKLAACMQKALEEGSLFEVSFEEELKKLYREEKEKTGKKREVCIRYSIMKNILEDLKQLEVLREEWSETLKQTEKDLYSSGEEEYQRIRADFLNVLGPVREEWERYGEQLLMFFLYTYFCGAVYDEEIYSKSVLAVFGTLWIQELLCGIWKRKGNITFEDVVRTSYRYAREIEHSDENLNLLEELFEEKPYYKEECLSRCILEERSVL